jgi:hypothetical protein
MEAQLGHCTLASKEAGISFGEMLVVAGLRGRRMRRLFGTTPSMSRAWPTVIDANLLFQPAVQEEVAELTWAIISSERAGAWSLEARGGMAAKAEAMRTSNRRRCMKRMLPLQYW